ncbi:MAG: hypothetical protein HY217_02200, partial [Candidatus Rokubacteria bacterium]|nr:hypothetical protein [Candidatus Rokubacteria bacterium]
MLEQGFFAAPALLAAHGFFGLAASPFFFGAFLTAQGFFDSLAAHGFFGAQGFAPVANTPAGAPS